MVKLGVSISARWIEIPSASPRREGPPLGVEAGKGVGRLQAGSHKFERDRLLDGLRPLGEVDDAHAALAQHTKQFVWPDATSEAVQPGGGIAG
jgi:hypothetical protein